MNAEKLSAAEETLKNHKASLIGNPYCHSSAVCIPLIQSGGEECVLLEVRARGIRQPGDICLPGGRIEPGELPEETAVREICEELCIRPEQVTMLGACDIYRSISTQVIPFVVRVEGYEGSCSRDEVQETFPVPLAFFLKTEPEMYAVSYRAEPEDGFPYELIEGGRAYAWRRHRMPEYFYRYQGHVIWGITAAILKAFSEELRGQTGF